MKNFRLSGFTLIELMITVVIVGILAAIAYPSYRNYMIQARRSDAHVALAKAAALQEKFYSDCGWYAANLTGARACATDTTGILNFPTTSDDGHYTIGAPAAGTIAGPCSGASAAFTCGFTMTATPVVGKSQDGDGPLRIDSTGAKGWNKKGAGTWVSWTSK